MINSNDLNVDLFQIKNHDFDNEFIWGLSETTFQIEEPSKDYLNNVRVCDGFSLKNNESGSFHLNYKEEINRIKQLGISNFRFSLSWSRIIPNGIGAIDQEGIDFYTDVIDTCIINGIEPFVTLCHWNLPIELEKKGGWVNREIINWFEEYVAVCINAFRDKVKYWIVLNEPSVITRAEYYLGIQKVKKRGENNFLPTLHHALLCQAIGFKKIKKEISNSQVGTTFLSTYIVPKTTSYKDVTAANRVDALLNRTFIEPSLGLGYPIETLPFLKGIKRYILKGDDKLILAQFDFVGIQNYSREVVAHNMYVPFINAEIIPSQKINSKNSNINFETHPKTIYLMIKKYSLYEGVKKIIITENEVLNKPKVNLKERKDDDFNFYKSNLEQVLLAKKIGGKIGGYFIQTSSTNSEWLDYIKVI
jgi:beta-glucosidase